MRVRTLTVGFSASVVLSFLKRRIDAKMGGRPRLAVATEQGAVHILDTTKRKDWDFGEFYGAPLN